MYFVTSNDNKLKEYQDILGIQLKQIKLELPEIQSISVEDVSREKVLAAYKTLNHPVFVEDTGLFFEDMGGLPGALVRSFLENLSLDKICNLLGENRKAIAKVCLACSLDGKSVEFFIGETLGLITKNPKGTNGFGWDAIFIPNGEVRTFAEMEGREKNNYMRLSAAIQFKKYLTLV
ncbi:MAG: non-canonical purine NTP pyrophosphatase [Candidatus Paceibacterota bacterium]|jgi:non-canonical purine NTP pyrophosphatase (RdgB/HAM1 family)|nr:non-canonical purine NTP pyrophosphatase [bacterium]